ncbi:hypothetical protein [Actinoplanes ianthinogenes]|uniref:DUF732 domain-containing protein n=1 Tax=Actinoplanes ianthinogenes TaxID=122358 RepID=A0ABM7M539_9ACTN|nr:hypothetical protein [Actinoplanes ianthinogenes]BCJ46750.1 hypothetical protein Aiant_74070 [Actinoplanes ianthinogenes]
MGLVVVAVGAAGCSSPRPVWLEGRTLPAASASPDRFVAAVRREMPELALDRRDEEIADLGDAACASIATGRQDTLAEYGISAAQAQQLRQVARTDLCPRQS